MLQGKIIKLLATTVVPFLAAKRGEWVCVVVESRTNTTAVGEHIVVHETELNIGKEMATASKEK